MPTQSMQHAQAHAHRQHVHTHIHAHTRTNALKRTGRVPCPPVPCRPPACLPRLAPVQLSRRLQVTCFPYLALLTVLSDERVALVATLAGGDAMDAPRALAVLAAAVEEHGAMLAAQRAEVEERVRDAAAGAGAGAQAGPVRNRGGGGNGAACSLHQGRGWGQGGQAQRPHVGQLGGKEG